MNRLQENWFAEGLIDFEYKKYILLAYLKTVEQNFTTNKLYPDLGDLVTHYRTLTEFIKSKNSMANFFPKDLKKVDLENFRLHYERVAANNKVMDEIEKILDYSIPAIKKMLEGGKEIYDWIEEQLELRPVGVEPLDQSQGYLLIRNGPENEARVFEYKLTIFQNANENFRGIYTNYVSTFSTSIVKTYENIKSILLRQANIFEMPAVYVAESEFQLPMGETLLPIAKLALVKYLTINNRV